MKRLWLIPIFILLLVGQGWATDYYVDPASSGGNGTTTATSGVNAAYATLTAAFAARTGGQSDNRILAICGATFREQVTVNCNGTSGHPFTLSSYGTGAKPIITGCDVIADGDWSVYSGNVYQAAVTTQPKCVLFNGTPGINAASIVTVNADYKWFWSSNVLYIYSASAPTNIEAGKRDYGVLIGNGKHYITVDGIESYGGNIANIAVYTGTPLDISGTVIRYCKVGYNTVQGILLSRSISSIVEYCEVANVWTGVLYASGAGNSINIVGATAGSVGPIIRYNNIHNNYVGINITNTQLNVQIYFNKIVNNYVNGIDQFNMDATAGPTLVYGNTIIHCPNGTSGHAVDAQSGASKGMILRNNIIYGYGAHPTGTNIQLVCFTNDSAANDTNYNNLYIAPGTTNINVGRLGTNDYATLALWQGALNASTILGKEANSIYSDPKLKDVSGGDFHLSTGSPCIKTGADGILSGVADYYGTTTPATTPNIGLDQNQLFGGGGLSLGLGVSGGNYRRPTQ